MLNINECRVGIIVLNPENEIISLNKEHLYKEYGPLGNSFQEFNPIPISTQCLLALGFENKGVEVPERPNQANFERWLVYELWVGHDLYFYVRFTADLYDKDKPNYSISVWHGEDWIDLYRCLFIHDIQNAFLQLTGKELFNADILKLKAPMLNKIDNFNLI